MSNDPEGYYRLDKESLVQYIEELENDIERLEQDNLDLLSDIKSYEEQIDHWKTVAARALIG